MPRSVIAGAAFLLLTVVMADAHAQVRVPDNVEIALTGRLHAQFNTSSVGTATAAEFLIRRARIGIEVRVGDLVSGKVEPDFGEGELSLKDAWARLSFHPAFRVTMGQFKRPFDLFELTSSSRILVVERAGGIRGVASCTGPGGLCAFSRFTERLQFADRDIGVLVDGRRGAVTWEASVTNGAGANRPDENGRKSFTGRVEVEVLPDVVVAGNAAAHDYRPPLASGDAWAWGYGGDVEIGNFTEGLHVQAGVVAGDNWANSLSASFFTAQTIVTYKAPVGSCACLSALEPLLRVSYGDPDTGTAADHGWLLTPGVNVHFTGRNRLALNVDYWRPNTGNAEWSLKSQMFFYF